MKRTEPNYSVGPVAKALEVLALVGQRQRGVSLAEVSRELNLPKTTAFRYLRTLSQAGFVAFDGASSTYLVGDQLLEITRTSYAVRSLRKAAQAPMRALFSEFNETVNLAAKAGGSIVYIDQVVPGGSARTQAGIGAEDPLHSTALGKAILAALPSGEVSDYFAGPLVERTGRTLVDAAEIHQQLSLIRKTGFATEAGENEDGALCIGAAILDEMGYPFAAMSVSGPLHRIPSTLRSRIGNRLREVAGKISRLAI